MKGLLNKIPGAKLLYEKFMSLKRLKVMFYRGEFTYNHNNLLTKYNADFMKDDKFKRALEETRREVGWNHPAPWRTFVNVWAAQNALRIEGDLVECGVYKGFTSHVLCRMIDIDSTEKTFFLVDSYQGLDLNTLLDSEIRRGMHLSNERYSNVYDGVVRAFSKFTKTQIIKGYVPDVLPEVKAEKVSYLHIDMNCVHPEISAAEYFWPKLTPGAIVVLDDYGFPKHIDQKIAFDKFTAKKGVPLLPLPTGQGIFIK